MPVCQLRAVHSGAGRHAGDGPRPVHGVMVASRAHGWRLGFRDNAEPSHACSLRSMGLSGLRSGASARRIAVVRSIARWDGMSSAIFPSREGATGCGGALATLGERLKRCEGFSHVALRGVLLGMNGVRPSLPFTPITCHSLTENCPGRRQVQKILCGPHARSLAGVRRTAAK